MPNIEIDDLGSLGTIRDPPPYQLPPEAWSLGSNMRVLDGGMERLLGWTSIFGTPLGDPHFSVPLTTAAQTYWLYMSLTKGFVYDGTNHVDITRASADYSALDTVNWNGTVLGGIPILNNGVDVPQYWATADTGTLLDDLPNWPSTLRAAVVRSIGPYLVAVNLIDTGQNLPHTIQWSHPADPGSIPVSWDYTDPTVDAGRKDLDDVNAGLILDAVPLQSNLIVYKQNSIWLMTPSGGQFIFNFNKFLETVGLLGPRCAAASGDGLRHICATQDDIIWHNGNQAHSILNGIQKRRLFNDIDTNNYANSFMFANPQYSEMWFCYPSQGQEYPDRAIIMKDIGSGFVVSEADGITFRNATIGPIEGDNDETWDANEELWDDDTGPWSVVTRRKVLLSVPASSKFLLLDSGVDRDGVAFTGLLQREALAIIGKKRTGEWIEDFEHLKLVDSFLPKVQGGPINVRLGTQQLVEGAITWGPLTVYDPSAGTLDDDNFAQGIMVDMEPVSGRAIAVEFSAAVPWRIDGYKISLTVLGSF